MNSLNVPQLRFPGFDGEWENKTLFDISKDVSYGMNAAAKTFDGTHKYIRITDIDSDSRKFNPNPLTSPEGNIDERFKLKINDIVFTRTGASVGKSYLYNEEDGALYYAGFLIKFSITKANSYFIFCQTLKDSYDKWVQVNSMRSGQPGLNAEEYKSLNISIPTLPEQQKIASFLSAVDEKIQQLSRKKKLLEQYKKGVMQQLFSGKLRFKDENGKEYPDWEEKKLGEVLKIGSGKDYKHLEKGTIPVFGTGGYMLSVNKFLHSGETVFIGRKGTIDKPFYFNGEFWTVDTLFYTHTFKNAIPKFIYCVFQQINWKLHNEASGVPSLSKSTIEKLKFDFPCVPEQQKIANFLSGIDGKIENVKGELVKTQEFKKGLLQQMFV